MTTTKSPPQILWLSVWALAGLQAAITLCWLVYKLYLPQLLTQFGFPAAFAASVLVLESALGVVMEPLMGGLSDRAKYWLGSRFPFISLGVILSATLFIFIPGIVIFIPSGELIRWILPVVLIIWSLTMTIFRSPAMALLGKYAVPSQLPIAVSLLTLLGGIVGAFKGIANNFLLSLGPIFCFAIASFLLLGTAFILRFANPPETPTESLPEQTDLPIKALAIILPTGFSISWGIALLMDTLTKSLKLQFPGNDINIIMLWISLGFAFAALPAGFVGVKIGSRQSMLCGLGITILSILSMLYLGALFPIIILTIIGFSLIVNGAVPFVLGVVAQEWSGLGIGIYFGGLSLAGTVFGLVFPPPIMPVVSGIGGALAFLVAGVFVVMSGKIASRE